MIILFPFCSVWCVVFRTVSLIFAVEISLGETMPAGFCVSDSFLTLSLRHFCVTLMKKQITKIWIFEPLHQLYLIFYFFPLSHIFYRAQYCIVCSKTSPTLPPLTSVTKFYLIDATLRPKSTNIAIISWSAMHTLPKCFEVTKSLAYIMEVSYGNIFPPWNEN